MDIFWNRVLKFAETTAHQVGSQLLQDFGHVQADQKWDGSLITRSDRWADQTIQQAIHSTFPSHGVLSEEGDHVFPPREWCWVIDPIDGTTNFAFGIPIWGISLGLLHCGTPVFGYVYLPPLGQSFYGFWYGSSGLTGPTGAFRNHEPIHPVTDASESQRFFNVCARSTRIIPGLPYKIRMVGMAAYSFLLVASGVSVAGVEASPRIWDIAAAWVIIQAAGAIWVPLDSTPNFPLKVGQDYSRHPYPTLVVNRAGLVPTIKSLVKI
ncbi:MAG: inositol monophosphatase [Oscillatoriales cyanobacterium RM2_1_1]|nr:inositol monophosphatase [Oscillatoriales cyanobacterium SM2_3_0]NJO44230.1 inositol monophosphatase [Oscillatoriales cyanobacterium RM2_1_1]